MQRTTIIAGVTLSSLLVTGLALAATGDDSPEVELEPTAAVTMPDDRPTDDPTPDDDPTRDDDATADDDRATPSDDATPAGAARPSDDATLHDDQPLTATVVATRQAVDAGSITVEATGLRVQLLDVVAADGWRAEVEVAEGLEVEVSFRRGQDRVDVKAEVDDGQLRFRVRDRRTDERTETYVAEDGTSTTAAEHDDDHDDHRDDDDDDRDDDHDDDDDDDDHDDDDHDDDD